MPHKHTHKYTILVPLETFEWRFSGPESSWPRHITVIPGMQHVGSVAKMLQVIESIAAANDPFHVTFGEQHMRYGERPAQDVVDGADALKNIHERLIHELGAVGCTFYREQFTARGEGYTPHVSGTEILYSRFDIHTLMIIAKYGNVVLGGDSSVGTQSPQQPSVKQIEDAFRLGGGHAV